jgi:hypothetical protein
MPPVLPYILSVRHHLSYRQTLMAQFLMSNTNMTLVNVLRYVRFYPSSTLTAHRVVTH